MAGGGNPQRAIGQRVNPVPGARAPGQPTNVFDQSAQALGTATQAATQATQFQPQSLASTNLTPYQDPFQQQVIDTTLADIERQRQIAVNETGAAASGAGAFGGTRHGVVEAETNRAALDASAAASAQLGSQGFLNAQQAAQQDIANQLAAQQLGLSAAGQLGTLSNLGFGMGTSIGQQQLQQGTMQQALAQQLIDDAQGQFQGFIGSPANALQLPLQALGVVPYGQTQTQTQNPGVVDYASLLLGFL